MTKYGYMSEQLEEWEEFKIKKAEFDELSNKALVDPQHADWFPVWKKAYELRKMVERMPLFDQIKPLQNLAMHIAKCENWASRQIARPIKRR